MRDVTRLVGRDSEVGRLLAGIYAEPPSRAKVSAAPAFVTRPWEASGDWQRPMRNAEEAQDPRLATFDREAAEEYDAPPELPKEPVVVPMLPPKRKSAAAIAAEKEFEERYGDRPQAPIRPGKNLDIEKRKLQTHFQFHGGKALPDYALPEPIKGQVPLSVVTGKRSPRRAGEGPKSPRRALAPATAVEAARLLLDELRRTLEELEVEIEEREAFLREMRALGHAGAQEKEIALEISERQGEAARLMKRIEAQGKVLREAIAAEAAALSDGDEAEEVEEEEEEAAPAPAHHVRTTAAVANAARQGHAPAAARVAERAPAPAPAPARAPHRRLSYGGAEEAALAPAPPASASAHRRPPQADSSGMAGIFGRTAPAQPAPGTGAPKLLPVGVSARHSGTRGSFEAVVGAPAAAREPSPAPAPVAAPVRAPAPAPVAPAPRAPAAAPAAPEAPPVSASAHRRPPQADSSGMAGIFGRVPPAQPAPGAGAPKLLPVGVSARHSGTWGTGEAAVAAPARAPSPAPAPAPAPVRAPAPAPAPALRAPVAMPRVAAPAPAAAVASIPVVPLTSTHRRPPQADSSGMAGIFGRIPPTQPAPGAGAPKLLPVGVTARHRVM